MPFDVVIPKAEQDPHLTEKLRRGIRHPVLGGGRVGRVSKPGGLVEPLAVTAATDRYQADADAVARFIAECCATGPHAKSTVADLYEAWEHWSRDDGCEPLSKKAFGESVDKKGFAARRGTGGRWIRLGIGLLTEWEEPPTLHE